MVRLDWQLMGQLDLPLQRCLDDEGFVPERVLMLVQFLSSTPLCNFGLRNRTIGFEERSGVRC